MFLAHAVLALLVQELHFTYLGEPSNVVRKRSINQKLRIHVHYDTETIPKLDAKLRDIIKVLLIVD